MFKSIINFFKTENGETVSSVSEEFSGRFKAISERQNKIVEERELTIEKLQLELNNAKVEKLNADTMVERVEDFFSVLIDKEQ